MNPPHPGDEADIAMVSRIDAIPAILEVICRTTGMGFAAVAKVTEGGWIACAVRDEIACGLAPGAALSIGPIGGEMPRDLAVDDLDHDPLFRHDPAPALHGFRSCLSTPIILPDGRHFGALCALDRRPARVSTPAVMGMVKIFAELIGYRVAASALPPEPASAEADPSPQTSEAIVHDLNNLLTVIQASADLLQRPALPAERRARYIGKIAKAAGRAALLTAALAEAAREPLGRR